MGVETATFISQLSATNPLGTDPISDGDNQIRLVKDVLQKQFTTLGAAAVTTTAGELNILDGVTSTAAELNILDGVTSTAAELNILDGVTSTAAELNILDGVTSTATELNYNDVTTLGTVETSKSVTADGSGVVNHADYQVVRPYFKDYAETVNAIGDTGGGSDAIDVSAGNVVTATVSSAEQTFTFTNPSATGRACSFTLILTNGGSQTVNWPASVDWAGGTEPTLTSSGVDILTFTTVDEGTIWYGFAAGTDMK